MPEPKTYRLDRIVDLLQVPVGRREQCLKELLLAVDMLELAEAKALGPFSWTDDGDMSCTLKDPNSEDELKLEVRCA